MHNSSTMSTLHFSLFNETTKNQIAGVVFLSKKDFVPTIKPPLPPTKEEEPSKEEEEEKEVEAQLQEDGDEEDETHKILYNPTPYHIFLAHATGFCKEVYEEVVNELRKR